MGYDIMILSDLLHFSTSHDALISSIQMLLAKSENAKIYVGVCCFTRVPTLSYKPKGNRISRQAPTLGLKSAKVLLTRPKKQG